MTGDRCVASGGAWWVLSMFADADVGPELDYLDRWHGALVSGLPLALVEDLVRGWLHSDFHGQNLVCASDRVCGVPT